MSSPKLDELDERIVEAFQHGDRLSNRAVARELGISEAGIRKRLKRLIETGVISYSLIVDIAATPYAVTGFILVQADPGQSRVIAEYIGALDVCAISFLTSGADNIRAYVYAPDALAMNKLLEDVAAQPGARRVEFRQAIGHAQHRYQLIMMDGAASSNVHRWRLVTR